MKKNFVVLIFSVLLLCLPSCRNNHHKVGQSPEKVTAEFVQAFYTGDFNNMYKYTLEKNHVIIKNLKENLPKEKLEEIKKNKIEIQEVKCTFQNDSVSECDCKFLFNEKPRKIPYDLRKVDGQWLIDLSLN